MTEAPSRIACVIAWQQPDVAAGRLHVPFRLGHVAKHLPSPMHTFSLRGAEQPEPNIRYCAHPITGKARSIDSKLTAIQRSARGFRSHARCGIVMLSHCGGVSLDPAF